MNECISCIKDAKTGICRDIKDKKAREKIDELVKAVNGLSGVDGGHLATDEDITNLQGQINNINEKVTVLENTPSDVTAEDITNLQSQIDQHNTYFNNLDEGLATFDNHIYTLSSAFSEMTEEVGGINERVTTLESNSSGGLKLVKEVITDLNSLFTKIPDLMKKGKFVSLVLEAHTAGTGFTVSGSNFSKTITGCFYLTPSSYSSGVLIFNTYLGNENTTTCVFKNFGYYAMLEGLKFNGTSVVSFTSNQINNDNLGTFLSNGMLSGEYGLLLSYFE